MKLILFIIIIFVIFVFGPLFVMVFSLQNVSTDKDIYSAGEDVIVFWSDFRLAKWSCSIAPELYHETENGWEELTQYIYSGHMVCLDGKLVSGAYPCDVISLELFKEPYISGNFTWGMQYYKHTGQTDSCANRFTGEIENRTRSSYETRTAVPGIYKVVFGMAEKIFKIIE